MNEPIGQILGNSEISRHHFFNDSVSVRALTEPEAVNREGSHKYVVEGNLVVYELYDRHGKLISRVPWSHRPIDKRA
mgnify:CR=1 FL=1